MILDKIFGIISPHLCIACGIDGEVLCEDCLINAGGDIPPRCAGCMRLTTNSKTCSRCRSWFFTYSTVVASVYEGIYENLVHAYKFDCKRQAVISIAKIMQQAITYLPDNVVVCPIPTAPSRIRQRGFDHAKLLARQLFIEINSKNQSSCMSLKTLLGRRTNVRQLGASRDQRFKQISQEFKVIHPDLVLNKSILLVDDVMTTGATLSAAANVLKRSGAKRVYSVVFTQKT